jgi:hypothetical protein
MNRLSFILDGVYPCAFPCVPGSRCGRHQDAPHHVQRALRARWHGYLPPGSCLVTSLPSSSDVEVTGAGVSDENPFGASFIVVLPMMRYPVDVRWHQDLVYNAVWSLLVEVRRWDAEMGVRRNTSAHDGTETKRNRRTIQVSSGY